ncbi:MAG: SUMF1/EgtB/PvdO family nonheme iron enzyme [Desulfobacterales bacterium]|nr:SUMF1/EgtB/PvdO family nonheme iron enzyme [Desulfobacterales bacterium]
MTTISFEGIDQAISALNYRTASSLKYRLVKAVRSFYDTVEAPDKLKAIDSDQLIKMVWQTGEDLDLIKSKQKNLNITKSSVNSDLIKLFEDKKNPEGIIIGYFNTFEMSGQAKDQLLRSFTNAVKTDHNIPLNKIAEVLNIIGEFLPDLKLIPDEKFRDELAEIKKIIKTMSGNLGLGEKSEIVEVMEDGTADEFEELNDKRVEEVEDYDWLEAIEEDEIEELSGPAEGQGNDAEYKDESETEGDEIVEVLDENAADEFELLGDEKIEDFGEEGAESDLEQVGLPFDNLNGEEFNIDCTEFENEKNILAERFDGYLGAMDRYYNQYIFVPRGDYIVGTEKPKRDELKAQKLVLPDFYFGKYPVTNSIFEVFIDRTGYKTTAEERGYGIVYSGRFQKCVDPNTGLRKSVWNVTCDSRKVEGACWYQPFGPGSNLHKKRSHPVVQVSLKDASAFAAWIGKRLPTEFEWEAAARTSKGNIFPWGNEWQPNLCNIENAGVSDTTPVDMYPNAANETGITDTLGNIMEWTSDECNSPHSGSKKVIYHIAKGGSWISDSKIRLYSRFKVKRDFTANIIGFRCIVD